MPIRGAEYVVNQIVSVLQANLPAEFDLMDAVWGDGVVLEDVENGSYYKIQNPVALVEKECAVLVYCTGTDPVQIDSITNTPGRYVSDHLVTVEYQRKDTGNEQAQVTQSRVFRAAVAIERVLVIKNITLGGTVNRILREGTATYGETRGAEDEAGEFTRIARIPFSVRVYENL